MSSAGQQVNEVAVARGIARPPHLYLACLLLGLALDRAFPLPLDLPEAALFRWTVGGGLILIGIAILGAGARISLARRRPCPRTSPSARWSQPASTA